MVTATTASTLQSARTIALGGDVAVQYHSMVLEVMLQLTQQSKQTQLPLGNDTTGDYVESLSGTVSNISVTGATGEGSTPTIDLIDAGPGAGTYGGANAIPNLNP